MYVQGRHLYTAEGEKVVLRGYNEMAVWYSDKTLKYILPEIAKTGANAVRLSWLPGNSAKLLDELIQNSLDNHLIPIIEMHNATGNWDNLQASINDWLRTDIMEVMEKHKKWVILNIANEVGGYTSNDVYFKKYENALKQLRLGGYKVPIMIDAANWGQDENNIFGTWNKLIEADELRNTLFSVHLYWKENTTAELIARLDNMFKHIVNDNIPLIIGEGPQKHGGCDRIEWPWQYTIEKCQEYEVGWLTWSWGAAKNFDCGTEAFLDITTNGEFGNWNTNFARQISIDDPYSIKNTSIRPVSLTGIPHINVTGITLSVHNIEIPQGGKAQINVNISPSNATNKFVNWEYDAQKVYVSISGVVNALSEGNTIIKAISRDGGFTDSCHVTITFVPVFSVNIIYDTVYLAIEEKLQLDTEVLPVDASDKTLVWSSSNPKVVSVSQMGMLRGKSEGTAWVKAVSQKSGQSDSCHVVVKSVSQVLLKIIEPFKIFPNPAKASNVNIKFLNKEINGALLIYDELGRVVNLFTIKPGQDDIILRGLKSGIYYVSFYSNSKQHVQKFIVE
jgi:mannan endo-1,4-beta-mannosidase